MTPYSKKLVMQKTKEPVYVIIPVHNRKPITLKCLETLKTNSDLERYHILVVDDGSTDGTSDAIADQYPDVTILHGDGNLWWTGAIKLGMEYAYDQGAEYFIWLNDDCYPHKGSIDELTNTCKLSPKTIVGGKCFDPDTLEFNYAGIITKNNKILELSSLNDNVSECDGISGHLACLPRILIEEMGYPKSKIYPHYYGDHAYTHRAKKRGYKLLINERAKAISKNNHPKVSWLNPDQPLLYYWQDYFKIKSPSYWKAVLNYYIEFFGFKGILIFVYRNIIRFWLFYLFVKMTPSSFRQFLKRVKNDQGCL